MPKTAPIGSQAIASRPPRPRPAGRRPRSPAAAHLLGRRVHVVRSEIRGPGDRQMAVRAAGRYRPPRSRSAAPGRRAPAVGVRAGTPAEERVVELLGRGHTVHHQTHPARVPGACLSCVVPVRPADPVPRSWSLSPRPLVAAVRPPPARCCAAYPHRHDPCRCPHRRSHPALRPLCCGAVRSEDARSKVSRPFRRDCRVLTSAVQHVPAPVHRVNGPVRRSRVTGPRRLGTPSRMGAMKAIISASELASDLAASRPPTLLDVRWQLTAAAAAGAPPFDGRAAHAAGHIPGAVFVDLDADLAGPPGPAAGIRCPPWSISERRCGPRVWSRTRR